MQKSQKPAIKLADKRHAPTISMANRSSRKARIVAAVANMNPTSCAKRFGDPAVNLYGSYVFDEAEAKMGKENREGGAGASEPFITKILIIVATPKKAAAHFEFRPTVYQPWFF